MSTQAYESLTHLHRRRQSRAMIAQMAGSGQPIKLDIGGGDHGGRNGWITVDTAAGCDLYWDLREGLPFAERTVDAIYSSHLFEHLTFADGQALLRECLRVLKPGGSFSIAVPDARIYVEAYLGLREVPLEYFGWEPAFNSSTGIDAINYIAYMAGNHKYMFDSENLLYRLQAAGFVDVRSRDFDEETDLAERDYESVYAIAHAPR